MDSSVVFPFEKVLEGPVRNGIYKPKEYHGRGAKIVNMGELFAYPRLGAIDMKRVELNSSEAERFSLKSGDLLFARRSLVADGAGKCCIVMNVDGLTTFESSIIRARPDPQKANSLYLFYFFSSPQGFNLLDTIRRQVAVAGITGGDLSKLQIPVPKLTEQQHIAGILGALDDKIDLNRRMNETLETLARLIFKDWFVDFGPVRAKMEGREPFGLEPDVTDLFPDNIGVNGLPDGWRYGCLSEIAVSPRRPADPGRLDPDTPYIGLEHIPRRSIALTEWKEVGKVTSGKSEFRKGEFLYGKLRPYFHKSVIAPINGVCSTDIVVVREKTAEWSSFLLCTISSTEFVNYTDRTSSGTKMPRTNWTDMGSYSLPLPPVKVASAFNALVHPMTDRIISNIQENRTLASLRELLVPKLISGEIRVSEAEKMLDAAL